MNNIKKTQKRKTGDIGEEVAVKYLTKHGFRVVERNYLKKCGEIDIIATKEGVIHIIEVKSVIQRRGSVIHETSGYRPEENMHYRKFKRLIKTAELYLVERNIPMQAVWTIDLITVLLDMKGRIGRVSFIKDITL